MTIRIEDLEGESTRCWYQVLFRNDRRGKVKAPGVGDTVVSQLEDSRTIFVSLPELLV